MNFSDLFEGALMLKTATFDALRERSDVFYRGFMVLFVAALVVGLFASLGTALQRVAPLSQTQINQTAVDQFNSRFRGPEEMRALILPYVTETAGLIYDITQLPPRTGDSTRPLIAILDYVGLVLATPFQFAFVGWLLFAGLLFHLTSRWLGGKASMAQMLGLTALAAAPQIFASITALLTLIAARGNIAIFNPIASLLSLVIAIWSAVIYVKATAVAQQFSIGNALVAIVIGLGLLLAVVAALAIFLVFIFVSVGVAFAR